MKFEDLEAWERSRVLVNSIYSLTRTEKLVSDFGLTSQVQRAAVSVMTNIAEGFERTGHAEKLNSTTSPEPLAVKSAHCSTSWKATTPRHGDKAKDLRINCEEVGRLLSGKMHGNLG